MKRAILITPVFILSFLIQHLSAQSYVFEDFVGTWHGTISSQTWPPYNDPMTMIIYNDHFYTETSGHLMPTIYPNTQQCDYDAPTNRMHWWYLQTVYAGQYFYQHFYYEVVYFNNDTLEMHYNFWDDPVPHPEVGTIFLVRENTTPQPANLTAQLNTQSIQLNWTAPQNIPSGSSLQGYNVYYSSNNGTYSLLDFVQQTNYTHAGYFQAGSHEYYVTAVYNIGESDPSNEVVVYTTAIAPVSDFIADNLMPNTADQVMFTDLSVHIPTGWSWTFTPSTIEYLSGTGPLSQHPVVRFAVPGTYTVQLTATNIAGQDSEIKVDYISVTDGLSVVVQTTLESICEGESAWLTVTVTGGSGYYTYSWTSNPPGFTSSQPVVEVTPEVNTTYMVEVSDGTLTSSGEEYIMVFPEPEIILGDWPEELCKQGGSPVQLMAYPEGGEFSGGIVTPDGVFDPAIAPEGWNIITYSYTSEQGCESSAQDSIYVDNCTATDEAGADGSSILVYPNPATDVINIQADDDISSVRLINHFGQVMKTSGVHAAEHQLAVTGLASGMYILIIDTSQGMVTRRILVQ